MNLSELYTEIIGEHSRSPRNKRHLPAADIVEDGFNPSCGDEIQLELKIENGIIMDAAFTGIGCAISQASTSMMIDLIKGKTTEEAERFVSIFTRMIKKEPVTDEELEELDEAAALENISNMPARVKCATLSWHTLEHALEKDLHKAE